jgi:ABC-type transport system involved in cytochrome c biogenesis permease subunit
MSKIKQLRPVFLIFIGLALAIGSSALTPPTYSWGQVLPTSTPALATPTAMVTHLPEVEMVPGSTNMILLLGTLLVVIVVIAIMWHRRDWEK